MTPALFFNPQVTRVTYGSGHPFLPGRAGQMVRLCGALGLLEGGGAPRVPDPATRSEVERFHAPDYLDALVRSSAGAAPALVPYGLGFGDNPVFDGLWDYCRLVAGGSLTAARWILAGCENGEGRRAFHPAGGLHHAHRDHASGFCYVNDLVLAIQECVDDGKRVAYVDVDAHHGDGVQEAFYEDPRVLTVSVHQDGRTIFPGTGFPAEIGRGDGRGFSINVPMLPGAIDRDYDRFIAEILAPVCDAFLPDILVTQIGVDALRDDPLALMNWSLEGLDRFLLWASETRLPWLAAGGGGYRIWNAIRGWSLVWARMRGETLPERRPSEEAGGAGSLPESWPDRIWDEPPARELTGDAVRATHFEQVREVLFERAMPRLRGVEG